MFKIKKIIKKLRLGKIKTKHGGVETPFFMPDATRALIKLMDNTEVKSTGINPMVVNTFHLYLQPGMKIIKKAGGVHDFMNWQQPLLSDSGGFQVFSLIHKNPQMGKIYDDKVVFKSPIDGSKHELTPEKSIQIQFCLGVDMMVCLDDCPPNEFDRKDLEQAVDRTINWAARCRREYDKQIKKRGLSDENRPLLFSVIQGGAELDLREKCAKELIKIGFDGYGFGARPIDKDGNFLEEVLQFTADLVPEDSLRFALGIGTPEDIARCALMGWDMFDCVIPTREGRHGKLFQMIDDKFKQSNFKKDGFYKSININNAKFANDFTPINPDSKLELLQNYSKAYLHHLFKLKEPLGQKLASLNNLEFYMELMNEIKKIKK